MIRAVLRLACLSALLILGGCVNGRALLLFEQPWWTSVGDDTPLRASLAARVVIRGYLPRVVVIKPQERPVDRLLAEAGVLSRGVVVVGPLLSYEWRSFLARFPSTPFILIGDIGTGGLPPNATVLRFDRAAAFREAGRKAAEAARGGAVGILVSASSELDDAETSAFTQGVSDTDGTPPPIVRSFPAAPDKAAIQAAIKDLRAQGIDVFLVGLGSLDAWALEVMKASGGRAVIAGWRASGAFASQILLSVEEDVPAGIALALTASRRGQLSVEGPVSLVPGGSAAASAASGASPAAGEGK